MAHDNFFFYTVFKGFQINCFLTQQGIILYYHLFSETHYNLLVVTVVLVWKIPLQILALTWVCPGRLPPPKESSDMTADFPSEEEDDNDEKTEERK